MIDFDLTTDEGAVVDAARQVAGAGDPWAALVRGGWVDLLLDDADAGMRYLGLVAEELGSANVSVPLAGSAVFWPLVFHSSADGQRIGVAEDGLCEDGSSAERVIVISEGGARVDAYADFTIDLVGHLDGDGLAQLRLDGEPVADSTDAQAIADARVAATAIACAEMAGAVRRIVDLTLGYVREREQFGRALATFQVVQHGCARLATLSEAATLAARMAYVSPTTSDVDKAKGWLSASSAEISAIAHQLHGATGFTQEYPLQRLTKRLRTLRFAWGDDASHHSALGRRSAG